jgi:tRNA pseudouridine55 synthase
LDGIVNINKPVGLSSFQVVNKVKKLSGSSKAGHAGTLDIAAEGVLIVLLGEACKAFDMFMNLKKTYEGLTLLGWESTTLDSDGEIKKIEDVDFKKDEIEEVLNSFKGTYKHKVPEYSAKKINGKTFYSLKRSGQLPPERFQETEISDIRLLDFNMPEIRFSVDCSSGTYIRTLAYDIGAKLGTSAYLKGLVRTKINGFSIQDSSKPEKESWENSFMALADAMSHFPHVTIQDPAAAGIHFGRCFEHKDIIDISGEILNRTFAVFDNRKRLLALAERRQDMTYKLKRVFNIGNN